MSLNQEYALARYRLDAPKDPPLFSRQGEHIWLNMLKNQGWFTPSFEDGKLTALYAQVFGSNFPGAHNWFRPDTINPKQARKIEAAFQ